MVAVNSARLFPRNKVAPGDYCRLRPFQRRNGLPQQTGRQQSAIAKRQHRVDSHNINVPVKPTMLKPVVHNQDLCPVFLYRLNRPGKSVRIYHYRRTRTIFSQHSRLIVFARPRLVSAGKYRTIDILLAKQIAQPNYQRRFARPPDSDIANAYNRDRNLRPVRGYKSRSGDSIRPWPTPLQTADSAAKPPARKTPRQYPIQSRSRNKRP